MKKIFKKNQIIITALALMIVIAGYLNFPKGDSTDEANTDKSQVVDYNKDEKTALDNLDESDLLDFLKDGSNVKDVLGDKAEDKAGDSSEVADKNDDDLQQVSDTGEIIVDKNDKGEDDKEEDQKSEDEKDIETNDQTSPGQAVFVSTTASPDYFLNARLSREQLRDKNKETLMGILENASVSEADKSTATQQIIKLTSIAEKENATEILLEAKGYNDAVVCMTDKNVNVVVNAVSLNEQDVAQIEDIIKRETGADVKEIVIAPVVINE